MLVLVLVLAGERPGGSPRARRGGGRALPACSGLLVPVWFVVRWDRLAPKRRFLSGKNSPPRLVSVYYSNSTAAAPPHLKGQINKAKKSSGQPLRPQNRPVRLDTTRSCTARVSSPASRAWISAAWLPFDPLIDRLLLPPKIWIIMSEHSPYDYRRSEAAGAGTKTKSQPPGSAPAAAGRSKGEGWSVDPVCACLWGVRVAVRTILHLIFAKGGNSSSSFVACSSPSLTKSACCPLLHSPGRTGRGQATTTIDARPSKGANLLAMHFYQTTGRGGCRSEHKG